MHPFARSGLASLSDLDTPEWRALFESAEQFQRRFLSYEESFRSPGYIWPRDPLHTWSRCWEYPYALYHLTQLGKGKLRVADVGSGVTFFPFLVSELGHEVVCVDIDPISAKDIPRAAVALEQDVSYRLTDGQTLPFSDGELDLVCCISVLEHVPDWERTVNEMARVLKPDGILLLTMDIDYVGDELGPNQHKGLIAALPQKFEWAAPEMTVHPLSLLRSDTGPYPLSTPSGLSGFFFHAKQIVKPLIGRKVTPFGGRLLAVHGMALTKRPA